MGDVERLQTEFIERYLGGGDVDPSDLLNQVQGEEREELEGLIDAFLVDAPARAWSEADFKGSVADRTVEELIEQGTLWPAVLPSLRQRLQIRRAELAEQLASAIGHGDQHEKVERYYHQMEAGQLEPDGVSDKVLEALGEILGRSASVLRRLGSGVGPPGQSTEAVAYARFSLSDAESAPGQESPGLPEAPRDWDEVDRLFRGRTG